MAEKSDSAFRTISEAADDIGVPAHVLRFWETRFGQLQPMKRAGGRRYYRPADIALLRHIKGLLHDQGLTIRGAALALEAKTTPSAARIEPVAPQSIPHLNADRHALQAIRDRLAAALAA